MNIEEAMQHFKSEYELCKKTGYPQQNFSRLKTELGWIPLKYQILINRVTGANLPIDLDKQELTERLKKEKE